jgi:hypothetical protein
LNLTRLVPMGYLWDQTVCPIQLLQRQTRQPPGSDDTAALRSPCQRRMSHNSAYSTLPCVDSTCCSAARASPREVTTRQRQTHTLTTTLSGYLVRRSMYTPCGRRRAASGPLARPRPCPRVQTPVPRTPPLLLLLRRRRRRRRQCWWGRRGVSGGRRRYRARCQERGRRPPQSGPPRLRKSSVRVCVRVCCVCVRVRGHVVCVCARVWARVCVRVVDACIFERLTRRAQLHGLAGHAAALAPSRPPTPLAHVKRRHAVDVHTSRGILHSPASSPWLTAGAAARVSAAQTLRRRLLC